MATGGSNRAIIAALLANLGIALSKFIAFLITQSSSMLAETIHSLADSGNQVLLLVGGKRAVRPATENHPFGFGRERYIYAFIVSIVLFSVGGLFALYEAYHKWNEVRDGHPTEMLEGNTWVVAVVVLVVAIIMESFSFRTAIIESNHVRGKLSWTEFIRRSKAPELPVVLLEDFAALVGLFLALIGVGMSVITDNAYWDAAGTACIGVLLVLIAITLAIETKSLLLGEAAQEDKRDLIAQAVLAGDSAHEVINMRTLHVGPDEILVAIKLGVTPTESAQEVAAAIDAAESRIRAAVPEAKFVFIEPDIRRAGSASDAPT